MFRLWPPQTSMFNVERNPQTKNEQTRRKEKDFKISIMLTTLSQILFVVFFFSSSSSRIDNFQPNSSIKSLSELVGLSLFLLSYTSKTKTRAYLGTSIGRAKNIVS